MATVFRLLRIPGVCPVWETVHRIYALEVNGFCCTNIFLEDLRSSKPDEYKKLMKVLKLIGSNIRVRNPEHVKSHVEQSGIYEMIAKRGNSRISFFYDSSPEENVICVLSYWKNFKNEQKQDAFFRKSVETMNVYRLSR